MKREKFTFGQFIVPNFFKKLSFMLTAVVMMGVTLSVMIEINWGTDPASFMNLNIAKAAGLSLGNTQVIVYGIMLLFVIIFGVKKIGFGTLANMLFIGYIADFFRWVWKNIGFSAFIAGCGIETKVALFIAVLILFVIVAAIYMNAQMGVAPYDALPAIISEAIPKVPYFIIRIIFDFSAIGIGLIASCFCENGIQGSLIGSVCISVLLGPAVSLVSKPLGRLLN